MKRKTALTWSWLNVLTKKRYDVLCDVYGDLDAALEHVNEALLKSLGCKEETIYIVLNRLEEFDPSAYEKELERRSLQFISCEDPQYPCLLKQIGDPPSFLYYKGDLSLLSQPCIGLVGSREMTAYGRRVTESFVPPIVHGGLVTVSGLALGIDALVAQETIRAGGKTVAVLGNGLAGIFPKTNALIARDIIENEGLILSEYPLDIVPDKYTFPARNRIIAGLSLATVVLEAGKGSGALITADLALDYNREVFAVPGQIFDPQHAGCHEVLSTGRAKLVTSADEILQDLGIIASDSEAESLYEPKDEEEETILKVLTTMPQSVTELTEKSAMEAAKINATLTMMELSGGAKNTGNGMWVRG
jgi:DNA processing protein